MPTAYTSLLGLALPVQGELSGVWGDEVNASITNLVESAIAGVVTLTTDANVTLSTTTGAANQARMAIINCTGARSVLRTITAPAASKAYTVINATTGGFAVKVVGVGPTTGITIPAGKRALIVWDGADFIQVASNNVVLTTDVTGILPTANGGTGIAFFTAAGPTVARVYTFPDVATTVLTTNAAITAPQGGTGVANNSAATVTSSGNFAFTRTLTATTNVTYPTTGTLSTLAGSEALTNKTYNGNTFTAGTGILTIAASKTATVNNTITLAGTDATTMTFPTTSATIARTDSANTFTGGSTATSWTFVTPALGTPASGIASNMTVDGTDAVGFRNIPQNSRSADYTCVLADNGKHIFHPSTDAVARTFTIPANGSVAYPIGTALTFVNMTSQVVTIAITTDVMRLAKDGTTGSRSLAQFGSATAIKIESALWLISGSALT